jgi:diguanylate cyclase (GGDEF)-like protein
MRLRAGWRGATMDGVKRPGISVFASADDARPATRTGGALALLASGLGAVLALVVSRWPTPDNVVLLVLLAVIALAGAVSLRAPDRVPPLAVVLSLLAGTAFISVGMSIVGRDAVDGADNEMLFLLPLLYSAYFCRAWVTAIVTATASITYGAVLLLVGSAMPAARWLTTSAALSVVAVLVTVTRARDIRRLATAAEEAGRDTLTGLLNRRGLAVRAATGMHADVVSLLAIDIDHFKLVNDVHGHAVGDQVLTRVAEALRAGSRAADLVARLGGEEFALVLPGCEAAEALRRAESLRHRVERESATWPAQVTLSIGAATTQHAAADVSDLLTAADAALYVAKAAGRNTVRSAGAADVPRNPVPLQRG